MAHYFTQASECDIEEKVKRLLVLPSNNLHCYVQVVSLGVMDQ